MEEFFLYTIITDNDVRLYGCIPDTIKITGINRVDEKMHLLVIKDGIKNILQKQCCDYS